MGAVDDVPQGSDLPKSEAWGCFKVREGSCRQKRAPRMLAKPTVLNPDALNLRIEDENLLRSRKLWNKNSQQSISPLVGLIKPELPPPSSKET